MLEYTKAVVIKFEDAGLFKKSWKNGESKSSDDRVYYGGNNRRKIDQHVDVPTGTLYWKHVANMLRVFFGRRPISQYRKSCVVDDFVSDIAKRSFVEIEAHTKNKCECGKYKKAGAVCACGKEAREVEEYVVETMTTRKVLPNSWGQSYLSWWRIRALLNDVAYNEIVSVAGELFDNVEAIDLKTVALKLHEEYKGGNSDVVNLVELLKGEKATPVANTIVKGDVNATNEYSQAGYRGDKVKYCSMVIKGITEISRISGKVLVPMSDDEVELFRNGNGFAGLLEGGLARIDDIIDLNYTNLELETSGMKGVYGV